MSKTMLLRTLAAAAVLAVAAAPAVAQPDSAPTAMVAQGRYAMRDGEAIYRNVCQTCHMADAKGATGAGTYPALAANRRLTPGVYPVRVVIHGQKGMPEFGPLFDDEQVANVVNYVRTHFGNAYADPVTAEQVKAQR